MCPMYYTQSGLMLKALRDFEYVFVKMVKYTNKLPYVCPGCLHPYLNYIV